MQAARVAISQFPRIVLSILAVAFSFCLSPPTQAQDDASIAGIVRDASDSGIDGATVRIRNLETGAERNVQSDAAGLFHAPSLSVGRYDITAEKNGFRPEKRSAVTLVVGQH